MDDPQLPARVGNFCFFCSSRRAAMDDEGSRRNEALAKEYLGQLRELLEQDCHVLHKAQGMCG